MRLTDEEMREVLARAEEIQRASLLSDGTNAELETVIQAAEEVGLTRPAVERALRERLQYPVTPPAVGNLVFARSTDGKLYVAEVLSVDTHEIRVRFLRGGEHSVTLGDIRPASFLPGERVVVNWPWWGTWTCTLISYDAKKGRVKVSDGWGETRKFDIAEVWLNPPRVAPEAGNMRMRVYGTLIAMGAGIGAVVGSVITAWLIR